MPQNHYSDMEVEASQNTATRLFIQHLVQAITKEYIAELRITDTLWMEFTCYQ